MYNNTYCDLEKNMKKENNSYYTYIIKLINLEKITNLYKNKVEIIEYCDMV